MHGTGILETDSQCLDGIHGTQENLTVSSRSNVSMFIIDIFRVTHGLALTSIWHGGHCVISLCMQILR